MPDEDDLLARLRPEDRARVEIDSLLSASGWVVQHAKRVNLQAS